MKNLRAEVKIHARMCRIAKIFVMIQVAREFSHSIIFLFFSEGFDVFGQPVLKISGRFFVW
jgi:hypothetical protein